MSTPEVEIKDLREKDNELVQKVQYWKITAAQRENEKLELMKEINELRLKLSRIRRGGAAQARKLYAALQTASEELLDMLNNAKALASRPRATLEPDSTTEPEEASPALFSPRLHLARRLSTSGRVLKVLDAKMR